MSIQKRVRMRVWIAGLAVVILAACGGSSAYAIGPHIHIHISPPHIGPIKPLNVLKIVANPVGAVTSAAVTPLVRKVAPVVHVDPHAILTVVSPPIETAPAIATAAARTELQYTTQLISAIKEGRLDRVAVNEVQAMLNRSFNSGAAQAVQPVVALTAVVPGLGGLMMTPPAVTTVNPDNFTGPLVYYVNGMQTPQPDAVAEAAALSHQISRPVGLIYDPTAGFDTGGVAKDFAGATYDRAWPVLPPVRAVLQANETTRQVAYLLYHTDSRISIVSHSRGCLIVRNALLIANNQSGGQTKDRVAWVATGLPLRDEEIYPKPARFRGLRNPADPVAQTLGLSFNPQDFKGQNVAAHDFRTSYVSQIQPGDFFN